MNTLLFLVPLMSLLNSLFAQNGLTAGFATHLSKLMNRDFYRVVRLPSGNDHSEYSALVKEEKPGLPVSQVTASSPVDTVEFAISRGLKTIVLKPYASMDNIQTVEEN